MMAVARLHQLFRNMEVVGKLQEYDKLSTVRQDFYIDKPSYTTACIRTFRGDRYDLNVQNIENNIDELIRGVQSINDPVYTLRATEHLKKARRGLVNLERTYIDRVQAQAAILVLRQDLDVRIENLVRYRQTHRTHAGDDVQWEPAAAAAAADAVETRGVLLCHFQPPPPSPARGDSLVDSVVYRSDHEPCTALATTQR